MASTQARRDGADHRSDQVENLEEAIAAEKLMLSEDEITQLEQLYVSHAISGDE